MKIHIMENIYGIKLIKDQTFDENCTLIYASNGVMKSSFTKGLNDIVRGKKPLELIYNRTPNYNIEIMGIIHDSNKSFIEQKNIICFNNDSYENISAIENIPVLLINETLSNKFNSIKNEQRSNSDEIFKILKNIFNVKDEHKIYDFLSKIYQKGLINAPGEIINLFKDVKFKDNFLNKEKISEVLILLLDSRTEKLKNSPEIKEYIDFVINQKNGLYVDQTFTLSELEAIQNVLSKEAQNFFKKENFLTLISNNGERIEVKTIKHLNEIIKEENDIIYKSKEVKLKLEKLKKVSEINIQSRNLFKIISDNNQGWIIEYWNNQDFLKSYFESIIFEKANWFINYIDKNNKLMEEIELIRKEVNENFDQTKWKKILSEFNTRMKLPFQIDIENKFNATMHGDVPKIIFKYSDILLNKKIKKTDNEVLTYISSGEKKALVFLSLLYKINVLIEENKNKPGIALILDDIVESFDYQNKYAILNYLLEFISNDYYGKNNKLVILSHNFDFIRTCQYHFRKGSQTFLVTKDNNDVLIFKDFFTPKLINTNKDNAIAVFNKWIEKVNSVTDDFSNVEKLNSLISLLPVIRNLNELKNINSNFNLLSKILHFHRKINVKGDEKDSENILWKDIIDELKIFGIINIDNSIIENKTIHDTVTECCEQIILDNDNDKNIYINLQEKIILAYGIRIQLEKAMVNLLNKYNYSFDWTKNYRTTDFHLSLIKLDKKNQGIYDVQLRAKVNKSLTLTNEVIHLNSFMYEPLIDLDIKTLKELYLESKIS